MKTFDPKKFTTTPNGSVSGFCQSLWQPVGAGRRSMYKTWKAKMSGDVLVIGRRGNAEGCFSIMSTSNGYDIAWNEFHSPSEVDRHLRGIEDTPSIGANAIYFDSKSTSKYLEVDLLEFLTGNAAEFLPPVM